MCTPVLRLRACLQLMPQTLSQAVNTPLNHRALKTIAEKNIERKFRLRDNLPPNPRTLPRWHLNGRMAAGGSINNLLSVMHTMKYIPEVVVRLPLQLTSWRFDWKRNWLLWRNLQLTNLQLTNLQTGMTRSSLLPPILYFRQVTTEATHSSSST